MLLDCLPVEPFAGDRLEDNCNPVGRMFDAASTFICTPSSLSQDVGRALGAQAGEAQLRDVFREAGFATFRRATETPFNLFSKPAGSRPGAPAGPYRRDVPPAPRRTSADPGPDVTATTWVIVASRDHARRGLATGFIMANHGKRPPLARMSPGDGIVIYSPTTTAPKGPPLRAITFVGTITGTEPEPSDVIPGGFRRRADLREIEPLALDRIRDHLPTSRLRFGCFALTPTGAAAIWSLIDER